MSIIQKIAVAGAALGAGAAIFLLGQATAAGISPETAVPGLLALVFSAIGAWGSSLVSGQPVKSLRSLAGAAVGGLVAADFLFIPAALLFAAAAFMVWRSGK